MKNFNENMILSVLEELDTNPLVDKENNISFSFRKNKYLFQRNNIDKELFRFVLPGIYNINCDPDKLGFYASAYHINNRFRNVIIVNEHDIVCAACEFKIRDISCLKLFIERAIVEIDQAAYEFFLRMEIYYENCNHNSIKKFQLNYN